MFGCQADKVNPKTNKDVPTLLAGGGNPHPLPTNICSGIDSLPLMDENGSTTISYCGPVNCPPTMPEWGFAEILNGQDNMYINLTLTPGWFVKRCDNFIGMGTNMTIIGGIPDLTSDWLAINIDPVVNKWQLTIPLANHPAYFQMATAFTVVKLNFFGGADPNSETRLWIKNDYWNDNNYPDLNTAAAPVHNTTPASCYPELNYCDINFGTSCYEHIERVKIGDIDNTSGNDNGYGDYTDMSTHLQAGTQTTITLTPGFSGQAYYERWVVFIDWNRDGDFFDSGELVTWGAGNSEITRTIDVPANAAAGDLRMRVAMRWGCWPACPCGNYYYGEAEDYSIWVDGTSNARLNPRPNDNINMMAAGTETEAPGDVEVMTEINSSNAAVGFRSGSDQTVNVSVIDANNQEVYKTQLTAKTGMNNLNVGFPGLGKGSYKYVITGSEDRVEELVTPGMQ